MLSFSSGKKGSESEYEVRRAAHSCRQDWGEKTVYSDWVTFATTLGGVCSEPLRCGSGECGFSYVGLGVCHHYYLWPVKFALCIASHFMQLQVNPIVENACKKKKKVHFLFYFKCEMYPLWERYFNRCVDVEFLFLCVHCGLWSLQFEKHNSDLDKTKQKLVEAANLVDKVTSDLKPEKKKKQTQILEFNMPIFIPYADTDSTTKL